MKKFMVFFTDDSSTMVRYFTTKAAAIKFADKLHSEDNTEDGSWVDCIIEGKEIKTYPTWNDIEKINK